jgi:hypothetical protein
MMLQQVETAKKMQWCCNRWKQYSKYNGAVVDGSNRADALVLQQVEAT